MLTSLDDGEVQAFVQHCGPKSAFRAARVLFDDGQHIRRVNIDLAPLRLYADSKLVQVLSRTRVGEYLSLKPARTFVAWENDAWRSVPTTRSEVFADKSLTLVQKRKLMRLLKTAIEGDMVDDSHKPIRQALQEAPFLLDEGLVDAILYSTCQIPSSQASTTEGFARLRQYLSSFGIYGDFSLLESMYFTNSEVIQGLCRAAAVQGATFVLGTSATFDTTESYHQIKLRSDAFAIDTTIRCKHALLPGDVPPSGAAVLRRVCLVGSDFISLYHNTIKHDPTGGLFFEPTLALASFAPGTLLTACTEPVLVQVYGSGLGVCPKGYSLVYMSILLTSEVAVEALDAAQSKILDGAQLHFALEYEQTVCSAEAESHESGGGVLTLLHACPGFAISYDDCVGAAERIFRRICGDHAEFLPGVSASPPSTP